MYIHCTIYNYVQITEAVALNCILTYVILKDRFKEI